MSELLRLLAPPALELPAAMLDELRAAYASPGRVYHTLDHVEEVARQFGAVSADTGWDAPAEVYLAVLYHDAVYVPGAADNEAKSAILARDAIARFYPPGRVDAERTAALVLATARHGHLTPADVRRDDALFLDCDMAILGASPADFAAYSAAIAGEYSWLPREAYEAGRRAFLGKLVGRRIFLSERFHGLLEETARKNVLGTITP